MPAAAELLARCAFAARRRLRGDRSSGSAAPRTRPAVGRADRPGLAEVLGRLGIVPGDVVMLHSSAAAVERMGWTPSDLIDALVDYLGSDGTLAMPSHPGLLREGTRTVYDVRRSSSTVGLMTELFRRRKGAVRSRYPLSAAAALGARAVELTSDHARSWAPHDEHSPYAKLAAMNGTCLCLGCPLDRMTVIHVAEDVLRDELGIPGFYQPREIVVRADGAESPLQVHARAPWLWWYLSLGRWTYDMYRRAIAKDAIVDGVALRSASARATVDWMMDEIRARRSIYPLAWINRWVGLGNPPGDPAEA